MRQEYSEVFVLAGTWIFVCSYSEILNLDVEPLSSAGLKNLFNND